MANKGITFDFAAESAKLRNEIDKVRKEVSGLNSTVKGIGDGFKALGGIVAGAFSVAAIGGFLRSVNSVADGLNDMAGRLSTSAAGLQSLHLAAGLAGGSAEGVNTAIAKMSSVIGDAVTGNKAAAESFSRIGLSARELAALKPDETFRAINQRLSEIPNAFERASAAQGIYGKGAKDIAGLIAEGDAAIKEVNRRLEEQGALLSDLDVAKIGVMNDELQFQQVVITNLGAKFLSGLSPAVGVATDAVADMLSNIGGATQAGEGFGVVMTAAVKIAETAAYIIGAAFEGARSAVAGVLYAITSGLQNQVQVLAFVAERLGLDVGSRLREVSNTLDGVADSFGEISVTAATNARAAWAEAGRAGLEVLNAAEIFEQARTKGEAAAAAAAARNAAAQGAAQGVGGYDPNAARTQTDIGDGTARKQFGAELAKDPLTDPKYLYQQSLGAALAQLATDQAAEQLNIAQVGNVGMLDALLLNHDMMLAAEQAKNSALGDAMSNLAAMAMQQGGTLGKIGKAYAIAQTIWSTGTAVMKAMAEVPFPGNIAAAAQVAAMGVAQLANIKKTNLGSGGSVVGARGGGVSASSPALTDTASGVAQNQALERQSAVQIVINGPLIETTDTARWLAEVLGEAINGQDLVFIAPGSRQAREILGT